MEYPLYGLTVLLVMATPTLARQEQPIPVSTAGLSSHDPANHASGPRRPEMQVLERKELPRGLIREKLRLPGFDPDESVPAIAIHPAAGGPLPVAICLHYFRGA